MPLFQATLPAGETVSLPAKNGCNRADRSIFLPYHSPVALKLRPKNANKNNTDLLLRKRGLFLWRKAMTKLPAKELLDGSKLPKTTTGEMKDALGKLRDYLSDLLCEDSADREAARLRLGIDLTGLGAQIGSKSDRTELETRAKMLEAEIAKRGIPACSIDWFAAATPPAGYLKADGAAVGRQTYPDLFAAIGTTYGEGDGETTFNLPDLIGRFAEGSATPGMVKEAGLPNITGTAEWSRGAKQIKSTGAFSSSIGGITAPSAEASAGDVVLTINARRSNPIYGASDTVQPPALTLLPCIKAFDATINTGLINVTELAQDVAGKAERSQVANLAMPSGVYVDLTVPESGKTLTTPADGYVMFNRGSSTGTKYCGLSANGASMYAQSTAGVSNASIVLPVKEGASVYVTYTCDIAGAFRFIYAEGSQP